MSVRVLISSVLVLLGLATPARAELVFFAAGKTMSVKAHRAEGDSLVLMLRSGGEIVMDGSLISRIEPDEVPYPEPPAPAAAVAQAPVEAAGLVAAVAYSEIIDAMAARHGVPAKLVKAAWEKGDTGRRGPRRRIYRLTAQGQRRLEEARGEFKQFVSIIGGILRASA